MEKFREHSEHMQEVRFRFGLLEGLIESADDEQNGWTSDCSGVSIAAPHLFDGCSPCEHRTLRAEYAITSTFG